MSQLIGYNVLTTIAFVAVVGYGVITGWSRGLVKEVCSTGGVFVGILLAWYCYNHFNLPLGATLLICLLFPIVFGMLATVLSKILNQIIIIGFFHRLGGALLGGLKYVVLLWLIAKVIQSNDAWANLLLETTNM